LNLNNRKIIQENIQTTIKKESEALFYLSESITDEMCDAVNLLFTTTGRLVFTGIGKSAIVAQKIVATLNSTGTTALFMHAADAIHGDLGMIREEDVVICISKSGETPEIKVLVPLVRSFGNTLMAFVSNEKSYLAIQSDYKFVLPMNEEADPNNLAPTTSTTLQMAMGDAIAVALLCLRGFSQTEFARFHPGGSLGKQLYLKVSDLIVHNEKPKVYLEDNIQKVILEITSKRMGATAVLDDNENLAGVITDGDLRRMLQVGYNEALLARDIMNSSPKHIQISALAIHAFELMKKHSVNQLIVLDNNRYKGMLHMHELLKEGIL